MKKEKSVAAQEYSLVRENIVRVFGLIGGQAAMAQWANKYPTEFYRLYARLIPVESVIRGSAGGDALKIAVSFVAPAAEKERTDGK